MAFYLYHGNRAEQLVVKLADEIFANPLSSVFGEEVIIVQSKGMERWVSMKIAEISGICSNIRFPFPNAFAQEIFNGYLETFTLHSYPLADSPKPRVLCPWAVR